MLAFGYVGDGEPGRPAFRTAFESAAGREALRSKVVLLHCTSDYPAPDDEINLRAIDTLAKLYGCRSACPTTASASRFRSPRWRAAR